MEQLTKHRIKAGIITGIIFGILVLIMLWIRFHTPIPPFPEGGGGPGMGLEVNLGSDDVGMGDEQNNNVVAVPDFQPKVEEEAKTEKVLTDDTEEDAIKTPPAEKKEIKDKPKEIKDKPKEIKKEKASTAVSQPKVNQKAMFPAQNRSNEGNTGQPGDQGNANGTPNSPLYSGTGNGSGGGTGGGSGKGNGTGIGDGISFSLDGRISNFLGKPEYKGQAEGKVVVEITVDKNGKVINAIPGVKGSTTLDEDLLQVAKQAALLSTFNKKSNATVQKGTITYRFILQ